MASVEQLTAFGKELRNLRKLYGNAPRGATLDEIAKLAEISSGYLSDVERAYIRNGRHDPTKIDDEILERLARVYDVPIGRFHKLLGYEPDVSKNELQHVPFDDDVQRIAIAASGLTKQRRDLYLEMMEGEAGLNRDIFKSTPEELAEGEE